MYQGLLQKCSRPYLYALFDCSFCIDVREKSIFFCCQKKTDKKKTSQERLCLLQKKWEQTEKILQILQRCNRLHDMKQRV